ncbi:hypothetical protein ACTHPH_18245 [Paenibacillus pasadenensis]|uniref:WYL domain-containing protein n=1 Tax=Paenibacillus pasadenensis TaxID=217090 RepID=A0A2N5NDG1_9BACL|nr:MULTISPECIES: hypothetical protein [Paenibacillus]PLT48358.1 hypothetical protein B8V81_0490 [Paenibacillus pasadenensis]QGG58161.1 hypothetical protein GE073_22995 [Paenibacillus sp. B01]
MNLRKWIGRDVELIYADADGRLTRRLVRLARVEADYVYGFDREKRLPRTFRLDGILAAQPADGPGGRAGRRLG